MKRRTPQLAALLSLISLAAACGAPGEQPASEAGTAPIPTPPLLIVGIDGATFDRIHPLIGKGRLPNLEALMASGSWGPLETLEPTVSPAIWTTVATGRLPDAHGILGFSGVPGHDMTTLPTTEMRRVRAFWNILSEHERSTGLVGWWVTWPAEPIAGWVVSDRAAYTRMEAAIGDEALEADAALDRGPRQDQDAVGSDGRPRRQLGGDWSVTRTR
jgi:hypothetical protein